MAWGLRGRLRREQFGQRGVRIVLLRVIERDQRLALLRLVHQREAVERAIRVDGRRREQIHPMPDQAPHRRRVEQFGAVDEPPGNPAVPLMQADRDVEFRGTGAAVEVVDRPARRRRRLSGFERQHRLGQRKDRRIALRLDLAHDRVERHLAGDQRCHHHAAGLVEVLAEGKAGARPRAQRHDVAEAADQLVEAGAAASAGDPGDQNVVLPAISVQHRAESGEQCHVKGDAVAGAQAAKGAHQLGRDFDGLDAAAVVRRGRARPVVGQRHGAGRAGQDAAPPFGARGDRLAGDLPLAAPRRNRQTAPRAGPGRPACRRRIPCRAPRAPAAAPG